MTKPQLSEFDRGSAVEKDPAVPGGYRAELDPGWRIGGGINGGLLAAVAARALGRELGAATGHRDPFSVTAHYLSASRPGPAAIRTEVVKHGRSLSTGTATLSQREEASGTERERLRVLASFGDLNALTDEVHTLAEPPEMPPPDGCVGAETAPPDVLQNADLLRRFDLRLDPDCAGFAVGRPSRRGMLQGWLRLADGHEPDPLMLLLAVDALPPVTFDLGRPGWTPTLELTAHVRARPAKGWLRIRLATRNPAGGLLEEDAEVWDEGGRLVAQSRQLARAPRPAA